MAHFSKQDGTLVETAAEARSGVTGHGVRYVLAWGMLGVVVAFAVVYLLFFR
jgi:hypothetical protein